MNKLHILKIMIPILLLMGSTTRLCSEVVWIVHPDVSQESMSQQDFKKLLLGKIIRWENGEKVILTSLLAREYSYDSIKLYSGKTPRQFLNHWKKMVFVGKGSYPKLFDSDDEMIRYIANTPGAIGCVEAQRFDLDVKKLKIMP